MSKLRQLIEAANRKCEMAWKVYSYNPEKDNELVDTSKVFDCIAAAQAHKRDILEKNPNYTVEIIAESSQKNEAEDKLLEYDYKKTDFKSIKDFDRVEKRIHNDLMSVINNDANNYDLQKRIRHDLHLIQKWEDDFNKSESAQKNETGWRKDTYSSNLLLNDGDYVAEVITSIIKNNIKVEIRKDYKVLAQKGSFSDKEQAKDWAEKALDKVKKGQKPESANIDAKNPGVLEVPDGKKVDELPQSHFEKLVDKKGYAEVIRALTNLEVWNKDKNKKLSSWASNMADKLKKKFRPESFCKTESLDLSKLSNDDATKLAKHFNDFAKDKTMRYDLIDKIEDILKKKYKAESTQKNEATFKPGDKVSVKSYYKDGNQFITLRNATIIKEITEKEAGQLDPAYNWKEPTGMKYYLVKLNTGSKKAVLASDLTLESAQKNEDNLTKDEYLNKMYIDLMSFKNNLEGSRAKFKDTELTKEQLKRAKEKVSQIEKLIKEIRDYIKMY